MDVKIENSKLEGKLIIPASKSFAHRILLASALCGEPTTVKGALSSEDIFATKNCLEKLGTRFLKTGNDELLVVPNTGAKAKDVTFNAKESGSTLRFFLPVVAALGVSATFIGEGRLGERPVVELLETLSKHNVIASNQSLPLTISGELTHGEFVISGEVSSQYITGLLFALPLLDGDSTIEIVGDIVSSSYIEITLAVLKAFGISIVRAGNIFVVKGNQKYISPKVAKVEGDWSSAGFFAVGGALCGKVELCGLNQNSLQGDRMVLELLRQMGADITQNEDGVTVKESKLDAITFSAKDCPDLVPIMSVALANAKGVSKVVDVERLCQKECDRLFAVIEMLSLMNIRAEYNDDTLVVYGGEMKANNLNSHSDHRIAMSGAIAGTVANGVTVVVGAECVKKSYPTFFSEHKKLGGKNDAVEF